MSFLADRHALVSAVCDRGLLIVARVGGVEWNKQLCVPKLVSHLVKSSCIMGGIKTSGVYGKVLGGTVHGKASGDTIMACASSHHQIDWQFTFVSQTATGQLVEAMAVHKGIAMGIVADGCVFGIIVPCFRTNKV